MVREHETREVKEIKEFKELRKRALLRDTLYGRGAEALSQNKFGKKSQSGEKGGTEALEPKQI